MDKSVYIYLRHFLHMMILVRHGKPRKSSIILGQIDDSLDSLILGKRFVNPDEHFDFKDAVVICSPLRRTQETANLFGIDVFSVDDRLAEIHLGKYQGMALNKWNMEKIMEIEKNPDENIHEGETYNQFYNRVSSFFEEYKNDPRKIIVFTHSGVIRLIMTQILKLEPKRFQPNYLQLFDLSTDYSTYSSIQPQITVS